MRQVVCVAVLLAWSMPILAQSTPQAEVFGGFSYLNYEGISINLPSGTETISTGLVQTPNVNFSPRLDLYGWNGSATANLLPWFGITTDFGGDYSNAHRSTSSTLTVTTQPSCVTNCTYTETYQVTISGPIVHTFLFGPQFDFQAGRARVYSHFLAGGMHRSLSETEMITTSGVITSPNITNSATNSTNLFAMAFGGGADFPIRKKLSWRVGADYLTSTGAAQNHIRISTGPVWKLGK